MLAMMQMNMFTSVTNLLPSRITWTLRWTHHSCRLPNKVGRDWADQRRLQPHLPSRVLFDTQITNHGREFVNEDSAALHKLTGV